MHRLVTKGFMVAGKRFALTKADADNDEVQYLIGRAKTVSRYESVELTSKFAYLSC